MNKRNRSVSPSANAITSETGAPKEETTEAAKIEEPATETIHTDTAEKSADKVEEPTKTESTPTSAKRQSVLGSLGRRASTAMSKMRAPKKENAAPGSEVTKEEESTEAAPVAEKPTLNGESKSAVSHEQQTIGDVVPEAINIGQPQQTPTVTASA